jgi:preprotein translocase subunit SecE
VDGTAVASRAARPARAAGAGSRGRAAFASARAADGEPRRRPQRAEERRGGGPLGFIQESIGELKKVEWPDQKSVISGTVVVLVACLIVGAYLWLNDYVWKYVVEHVLLR